MMGRPVAGAPGAWRPELTPPALALTVGVLGVLLASDLPADLRRALSGTAIVLGGLCLALVCLLRWRTTSGPRRRGWGLLTLAGIAAAGSNLEILLAGNLSRLGGAASPADLLIVVALVLGAGGVASFPRERWRGVDLLRIGLEGLVIGGSCLFVASLTLFPQVLQPDRGRVPGQILLVSVAVIDVMITTMATLLVWRGRGSNRGVLFGVGLAFAFFAVSDFAAAVVAARAPFSFGTLVDLGWIAGYAVLVPAVMRARPASAARTPGTELSAVLGTALMFGVFLLAAGIGVMQGRAGFSPAAIVVGLIVLAAVAARQLVLIVDNENLRRTLERRVSERTLALRAITQQTTLLVNSVGEGIYGVDAAGLVTFVNPAAARALGYSPGDLIGRDAHATFHAPGGSSARTGLSASCYITSAIERQVVTQAEEDWYRQADGCTVPVEVTATPVSHNGAVQGAVVVFRDITQRLAVNRMKNEFVSMVSHELRTPLTSIRGSLGLLSGGAFGRLDPRATRMVELAVDNTDRLARLVDDILDIERIESGALPMTPGIHVVIDLVQAAVAQVQVIAADGNVDVTIGPVTGWVRADADRVVQVLINLLSNAIKFSPPGSRVWVAASQRGASVELRVTDAGRGVPSQELEVIFARFQQVDSSDARDKGGVGLGLSISRSLVERMGGRIWAENNPGAGMTFRFTLPGGPLADTPGDWTNEPAPPGRRLNGAAPSAAPPGTDAKELPSPPLPADRELPSPDGQPTVRLSPKAAWRTWPWR
ncbi:MAG: ATP-binding protein [Actinomycetes bacterium]